MFRSKLKHCDSLEVDLEKLQIEMASFDKMVRSGEKKLILAKELNDTEQR